MDVRRDPRIAGQVTRYHTWPSLSRQSVGEHSWQYARILLSIWTDAPREVVVEAIFHDVGEIGTGDIPYPVKKDNPDVGAGLARLEATTRLGMAIPWGVPAPVALQDYAKDICKFAEFVEMWEWGLQEGLMGNRFADLVAKRCLDQILERLPKIQLDSVKNLAAIYIRRRWAEWVDGEECPV